jgi:hypothetical protein
MIIYCDKSQVWWCKNGKILATFGAKWKTMFFFLFCVFFFYVYVLFESAFICCCCYRKTEKHIFKEIKEVWETKNRKE